MIPNSCYSFTSELMTVSYFYCTVTEDPTDRVFDETLFRIFVKHETRENALVFAKLSQVSQDQIFAISVFRES
jgi:hypothetical protein